MYITSTTVELPPVPEEIVESVLEWAIRTFGDNKWVYDDLEDVDDLDISG